MDKALKTVIAQTPNGEVTIVIDEHKDFWLRAKETASAFGFKDVKECIRNYAKDTKMIVIPTEGGNQPVKCLSFEDMVAIAKASRLNEASQVHDKIIMRAQQERILFLEFDNMFIQDDLNFAICSLKDLRKQLDEILMDLE